MSSSADFYIPHGVNYFIQFSLLFLIKQINLYGLLYYYLFAFVK
jgi:hypothetical protein